MGDSMHEIGRSIQRIDDPAVFGLAGGVAGKLILLAKHGMVRESPQDGRFHDFLGGKIGLGDKVCRPFGSDAGLADPVPDCRPGRTNGLLAGLKIRLEFAHEARLYRSRPCLTPYPTGQNGGILGKMRSTAALCPLRKAGKWPLTEDFCRGFEKLAFDSGQDRETWYDRGRWFWPLLCSGPAVSLHCERRGFYFSCRTSATIAGIMNPKCWLLEGRVARLNLPGVSLAFDAQRPADGLAEIAVGDRPWSGGRLLGINGSIQSAAATTLTDWLVRGDDLIAVYETGQPDAAQLDLLWHAVRPAAGDPWLARIDLLLSVHTDQLDWRHEVRLESLLPEMTVVERLRCDGQLLSGSRPRLVAGRNGPSGRSGPPGVDRGGRGVRHPLFTPAVVSDRIIGKGCDPSWPGEGLVPAVRHR